MTVEATMASERLVAAIADWCREQHDGTDLMIAGVYVIAETTTIDGRTWLHNGGLNGQGEMDTAAWQRLGWLQAALLNEQGKWSRAEEDQDADA